MNEKYIVGLHDPAEAQDAATKNYVDNSLKKCHIGYIPNLEADISITGFVASASSSTSEHKAYKAFTSNNTLAAENGTWISGDGVTVWLQIQCPEPVIIWRIALAALGDISAWNLSASNDGSAFTPLFSSTAPLPVEMFKPQHIGILRYAGVPTFYNISTTTAYSVYRLTIPEIDDGLLTGIRYMQLYVYDT